MRKVWRTEGKDSGGGQSCAATYWTDVCCKTIDGCFANASKRQDVIKASTYGPVTCSWGPWLTVVLAL